MWTFVHLLKVKILGFYKIVDWISAESMFSRGVDQPLGVCQHLGVAPKCWLTPFSKILILFVFFHLNFLFVKDKDIKMLKKMIVQSTCSLIKIHNSWEWISCQGVDFLGVGIWVNWIQYKFWRSVFGCKSRVVLQQIFQLDTKSEFS